MMLTDCICQTFLGSWIHWTESVFVTTNNQHSPEPLQKSVECERVLNKKNVEDH